MRLVILLLFVVFGASAQRTNLNSQKGFLAEGYDLVAYFDHEVKKGSSKYAYQYKGAKLKFSSAEHLAEFKSDPEKYLPQYGGWCAYAMATDGEKVKIDPKTYEIRDGKLYLFYNAFFNNTHESWLEEGPAQLVKQADKNWMKFE